MMESSRQVNARQTTGIEGLDVILHGGLPSNRLYVTEGDPGSGKTTLALQFLLEGVRQGQKCLYVTLSETMEELHDVATSHGWRLDDVHILELNAIASQLAEEANYTVYHASDVELGETVSRIREEVERTNPDRVALDSVSELKILAQTSARYRREVLALKQFFAGRNCTVLILDDLTTREGEQQLQSIAHGVIRMEREAREYGTTRRQVHIVKMRGVRFEDGRHDFNITTGGIEVYPRLTASKAGASSHTGVLESGVAELDALLGGGIDRASSTLVLGPVGCGKSTLCAQYLIAALARGEHAICYLFEEGRDTFLHRAAGVGADFAPYLALGQLQLQHMNPAELSTGSFSAGVRDAVERRNASLVVIDSLNGYLNGMPSEQFLLIHMHELLSYLGQKGIVTLLTLAQHGMVGGAMVSPVDVSFLADTVILLRYFEAEGAVRQALSVVKKRRGKHERTIRELNITSTGVEVGEVLKSFHGVLTGVPTYVGHERDLLERKTDNADVP